MDLGNLVGYKQGYKRKEKRGKGKETREKREDKWPAWKGSEVTQVLGRQKQ